MKEFNSWNADKYTKSGNFVSKLGLPVVELLAPKKGETILDLGCGEGSLTLIIKELGSRVIGVDISADMVEKSRDKGLETYLMSATNLEFENKFDAIFSNATLHWIKDYSKVIKEVDKVLKSSGRFVAEFGAEKNILALRDAMQSVFRSDEKYGKYNDPWFFPTQSEYQKALEKNGFRVKKIETIKRPTPIADIKEWLEIFANGIMKDIPSEHHEDFKLDVETLLRKKLYTESEGWVMDYVRLRIFAEK